MNFLTENGGSLFRAGHLIGSGIIGPRFRAALCVAALAATLPGAALAHGGEGLDEAAVWTAWRPTPEIVLATLALVLVYARGIGRRASAAGTAPRWRHAVFFIGVGAVFLALQSPIDPMAERLFWMHQVQHMLLRLIGPMLIALPAPQGLLTAGLPRGIRRRVLVPVLSIGPLRAAFRVLTRPDVAFALFVASLYFWQIPSVHNAALLDPFIHYLMHFTMLAAGLLFWFLVFDPRDPPKSIAYPLRLLMLLGTILSNILLGSLTTLKETVLYTVYDIEGRLFGIDPLTDEVTGGYTIWVPSSMMCVIAILIVAHRWGGNEQKVHARRFQWSSSNSRALDYPETAEELRIVTEAPNRSAALVLSALSLSIFLAVVTTVVLIHTLT